MVELTRHERHELAAIERTLLREAPDLAALIDGWGSTTPESAPRPSVLRRVLRGALRQLLHL